MVVKCKIVILDSDSFVSYDIEDIAELIESLQDCVMSNMDTLISSVFAIQRRLARLENKFYSLSGTQDYIAALLAELNMKVHQNQSHSCIKLSRK